jgi:TrmH family RNA methyltransferase
MANFGFPRLAVVAPYEEHWREAKSAIGAQELLQKARRTQCLAEAVADCTLVAGTGTLTHRKPEQRVVSLPSLTPIVHNEIARGGHVAVVFGPEKHGLTREDLSVCHVLVEIPTDPRQPSMNLGQAVAVCLYELTTERGGTSTIGDGLAMANGTTTSGTPATARDLELLADVVAKTMAAANYSPSAMRSANRRDLHLTLRRLALTRQDTKRILGLFRRILWRLERRAGKDSH